MHKPSFASLTVLHYFAGTSHPPIKIRPLILDMHLHPRFGLAWNLVADFGILGSTILAVVTHGTTDVQHDGGIRPEVCKPIFVGTDPDLYTRQWAAEKLQAYSSDKI